MLKKLLSTFVLALVFNWIWENLHSVLYAHAYGQPIIRSVLWGATLYDATFILLLGWLFWAVPYLRSRLWWALILGLVAGILGEWYALREGWWAYAQAMPIVPLVKTGLSPTIQLGLLSYLVFKLVKLDHYGRNS